MRLPVILPPGSSPRRRCWYREQRESSAGMPLAFPALAPRGRNFGVNVVHRELVEALALRVTLDVFEPIGGRRQGLYEICQTQDEDDRLAVALHQKTLVVVHCPVD